MRDLAKLLKYKEDSKFGFALILGFQIQWISQQHADDKELSNVIHYYLQKPSTNVVLLFSFFTDSKNEEFTGYHDLHRLILESIKW